jgi:hypothetical protein
MLTASDQIAATKFRPYCRISLELQRIRKMAPVKGPISLVVHVMMVVMMMMMMMMHLASAG